MSHDVYICCDGNDMKYADAVHDIFEENGIKSWIKSRHFSSNDSVDAITNAIADSKCFVLIFSKNAKTSNHVITETDIAFSRNVPIIVFNIDGSRLDGKFEFILETQTKISSYPKPKKQLGELVKKTSEVIEKPVDKPKINLKHVRLFEKPNPYGTSNKIKKLITIAIPIVIAVALIYFFVFVPTGQHTTEDGIFSMNVTGVDFSESGGEYKYIVRGESYNMPSDSTKYFMNIKFFDKNDNMVYEVNSTVDEFKYGIIWQGNLPTNNVTHVGFKLTDLNNKILSNQTYVI